MSDSPCSQVDVADEHNDAVYREQVRIIYQQGPFMVLGVALVAAVTTAFLWRFTADVSLLLWLVLVLGNILARYVKFWLFWRQEKRGKRGNTRAWGNLFWLGSLSTGITWGALPLVFYHQFPPVYLLLISTMFAAMVAINAAASSAYIVSFYAFSIPLVTPLIILHLTADDDVLVMTGVMLLLFLLVNVLLGRRGSRHQHALIEARLRNADLMSKLSAEKTIAENAVVHRDRFIATASHDLRQPIHALGMQVSSLKRRVSDPQGKEIIVEMSDTILSLGQLMHSLLDISRLDAGVVEARPNDFCLQGLISKVVRESRSQAERKGLVLLYDERDYPVRTDPVLFERILRNLLANAIRYTDEGQVSIRCSSDHQGWVSVSVIDTGVGIPVSQIETVFREYTQLDRGKEASAHGLGLGLSIVRKLCEIAALQIDVRSEAGRGSEFTVLLPPGRQPQQMVSHKVDSARLSGKTLLLVEDEPVVLDAMCGILQDWGCQVLPARNPQEAMMQLALSEGNVDAVISDYTLSAGENGLDLVFALREGSASPLPALMLTGDTSAERLREVTASGLRLLHKPVAEPELHQALCSLVFEPQAAIA